MPPLIADSSWEALKSGTSRWELSLETAQLEQIQAYLEDLLQYNLKVNLTADTDPSALLLRHIADGLAAVAPLKDILRELPAPALLDLGSGGGFIGMAIKIAWPQARVTLMESLERKYRFLNATAARSGLKNLRVLKQTAVERVNGKGVFDCVVERALAELPQAVRLALPLAKPGGFFLAYQSERPDPGLDPLQKSLAKAGGRLVKSIPYRLPLENRDRYLTLFQKT